MVDKLNSDHPAAAGVYDIVLVIIIIIRVRFHIIGNARIKHVGKSQSCLVSKLPIMQLVAQFMKDTVITSRNQRQSRVPFGTSTVVMTDCCLSGKMSGQRL